MINCTKCSYSLVCKKENKYNCNGVKENSKNFFVIGEIVICKENVGLYNDLKIGKEYKVITTSYSNNGNNYVDVKDNKSDQMCAPFIIKGVYSDRFITPKSYRFEKLKKLNEK